MYIFISFILGLIVCPYDYITHHTLSIMQAYFLSTLTFNLTLTLQLWNSYPQKFFWANMIMWQLFLFFTFDQVNKYQVLFTSSYIGSYIAIRGLSIVLGKFPDEQLLLNLIGHREHNQVFRIFGITYFYYMMGVITLTIIGGLIQYFHLLLNEGEKDIEIEVNKK